MTIYIEKKWNKYAIEVVHDTVAKDKNFTHALIVKLFEIYPDIMNMEEKIDNLEDDELFRQSYGNILYEVVVNSTNYNDSYNLIRKLINENEDTKESIHDSILQL